MDNPKINELPHPQMLDICAGSTLNDDMQELRRATVAFLTDRYDNDTYVATPDDIVELQEATTAFLADRADGECFCFDPVGAGLLLPGEQFLLPVSIAVNRARLLPYAATDIVDLIDECLVAQMTCEDAPHTPILDALVKAVAAAKVEGTSFDDALKSKLLPQTTELDEQRLVAQAYPYVALEDLLGLSGEMDRLLGMYDDTDSNDSDGNVDQASNYAKTAYDASDALCRFQASNAASFFDPVTDTTISYASFSQILEMEDRHMQFSRVQHFSDYIDGSTDEDNDETDGQVDEVVCVDKDEINNIVALCNQFPMPPTAQPIEPGLLEVITYLPTIWEENEPYSAASNSSMNFANHPGSLKSFESRGENFLDDKEYLLQGDTGVGDFDSLFADDIWANSPDLDLALPISQTPFTEPVNEAELELFETLTAVFGVVQACSRTDVPTFGADLKRKLHLLMSNFRDPVLTERLDEFIEVTADHMIALDQYDSIVT